MADHIFPFVGNNQNSCGKFINIYAMQAIDHERKICNLPK